MKFFLTCLGISVFLFGLSYEVHSGGVKITPKSLMVGPVGDSADPPIKVKAISPCGRHFVVCRGVHSVDEYNQVVRTDSTVRKLYAVLGPVQITKLDKAELAYDSYRVGNSIYWTKKPKFIPAGEPIISDGKWAVLIRCGNLIALTPQIPVADFPEPQDLYPPPPVYVVGAPPEVPYAPPPLVVDTPEPVAPHIPEVVVPPSIYTPPTFVPPGRVILTGQPPKESFPSRPVFPGGPVSTPEPSTFGMLGLGLFGLGLWWRRKI